MTSDKLSAIPNARTGMSCAPCTGRTVANTRLGIAALILVFSVALRVCDGLGITRNTHYIRINAVSIIVAMAAVAHNVSAAAKPHHEEEERPPNQKIDKC